MSRERSNRKRVTYTTSKGRRIRELRSGASNKLWAEVKELSKILADYERRLIDDLPSGIMERVKLLPDYVQEFFRKDGLIEGTKSKKVPTLGVFLAEYGASRPGKESMHRRLTSYLVDYPAFGMHKRLNDIKSSEAAGILSFWANDRKKKGKRGGTPLTNNEDKSPHMGKVRIRHGSGMGVLGTVAVCKSSRRECRNQQRETLYR